MGIIFLVHRPEWWLLIVAVPVGSIALLTLAVYLIRKKLGRI